MQSSSTFYSYFAKTYSCYSSLKKEYLSAVNNFIRTESGFPKSLIDVGAGDGKRSKTLADLLYIDNITLVDNSNGMLRLLKKIPGATVIKSDISSVNFGIDNKYDVVLCLWNVIGHIPVSDRKRALTNLAYLVKDDGVIFLDVNNRYNTSQYGIKSAAINILKDCIYKKSSNGDFVLDINTPLRKIQTIVHIFSPQEIEHLISSAELTIGKRMIVNYKSGKMEKYIWNGQLIYKLLKR